MELNLNTTNVVCFKLISGNELVGKLETEKTDSSFVSGDDVIYLNDALLVTVRQGQDGNPVLSLGPITGLADVETYPKGNIPFALFRGAILGQIPLDPEINKMYRNATSKIQVFS